VGQWESAKLDCDKALELDPNNVKAAYHGATAALHLGDALESKRLLTLSLRLAEAGSYPLEFVAEVRAALASAL
jgi:galactose mutarotase-like enzyme